MTVVKLVPLCTIHTPYNLKRLLQFCHRQSGFDGQAICLPASKHADHTLLKYLFNRLKWYLHFDQGNPGTNFILSNFIYWNEYFSIFNVYALKRIWKYCKFIMGLWANKWTVCKRLLTLDRGKMDGSPFKLRTVCVFPVYDKNKVWCKII